MEVKRNNKLYRQMYNRGKPVTDLEVISEADGTGTKITFKPDGEIFETLDFDADTIAYRLREMAFLTKGVKIEFLDERSGRSNTYQYDGGIISFVEYLNPTRGSPQGYYLHSSRDG